MGIITLKQNVAPKTIGTTSLNYKVILISIYLNHEEIRGCPETARISNNQYLFPVGCFIYAVRIRRLRSHNLSFLVVKGKLLECALICMGEI